MVYQSQLELSDHATVHHSCWYSARGDRFIPTPEVDLAAKRLRVHEGESHRHHHVDMTDVARAVVVASKERLQLKPVLNG